MIEVSWCMKIETQGGRFYIGDLATPEEIREAVRTAALRALDYDFSTKQCAPAQAQ